MSDNKPIRLNKYIAQSGICSRREADKFIENGRVKINGKKVLTSRGVSPRDVVMVNGQTIEAAESEPFVLIALNKPAGIVCTTESSEKNNIVSFTNYPTRIFPIGRLDKDSTGLIFLTNDGDLVNKILRAGNNHEKEYVVTVDKPITDDFILNMSRGVPILGTVTKKCIVEKMSTNVFKIILVQGLNRQIRRMAEYFGYEVQELKRVRIMHISLNKLPEGDFRNLDDSEVKKLFKLIEGSSSEKKSSQKKKKPRPQKSPSHKNSSDRRNSKKKKRR